MARRKCPKCNTSNRGDAIYCRHCGEKLINLNQQNTSNTSNGEKDALIEISGRVIASVLFMFGIIVAFLGAPVGLVLSVFGILIAFMLNRIYA